MPVRLLTKSSRESSAANSWTAVFRLMKLGCCTRLLTAARGQVKYGGSRSSVFQLDIGVRHGSLLGGLLWTIYVDSLLNDLQQSGLGCHFRDRWCGAFLYADDICLISSTSAALKGSVQITEKFAEQHQVKLNPLKSRIMMEWSSGVIVPLDNQRRRSQACH